MDRNRSSDFPLSLSVLHLPLERTIINYLSQLSAYRKYVALSHRKEKRKREEKNLRRRCTDHGTSGTDIEWNFIAG